MRYKSLLLAAICAATICHPQNARAETIRGEAYALADPQDSAAELQSLLADPDIDGLAVRTSWDTLEPRDDAHDWKKIDEALALADQAKKKITLHIVASSYASPPRWLQPLGARFYSETNPFHANRPPKMQALPWDNIYLSKWSEFLQALSAHIDQSAHSSALARISVTVPVPEMSLIACRNDKMSDGTPYDRQTYLNAWKTSLNATQKAFPRTVKMVSAPVRQICMPDSDGATFYKDVLRQTYTLDKKGFSIFAADLNAMGSQRLDNLGKLTGALPVDLQFIWSRTNDPRNRFKGNLADAICKGFKNYGGRYFEVYKSDIRSPDPQDRRAIQTIHNLQNCP